MTTKRRRPSSGSSSGIIGFGILVVIGLAVQYYWWFLGAAALVGLFFAARALYRHLRERQAAAAREAEELAYRADRQYRWARRGDSRGVYGDAGAELMRSITPEPPALDSAAPQADVKIAAIANSSEQLTKMVADKPPGWRWAAFASVLVQRRAAVRSRLRGYELGCTASNGARARSGVEVAHFVTGCMDELSRLVSQVEAFMLTPAFIGAFGERGDESTADADGIVHTANRLMDYHDRFLRLAE
jgi:hypothetical protein